MVLMVRWPFIWGIIYYGYSEEIGKLIGNMPIVQYCEYRWLHMLQVQELKQGSGKVTEFLK
jgi:hypothetical protein